MPYRIEFRGAASDIVDRLIDLGAVDVACDERGGVAALMPDALTPDEIASVFGTNQFSVSQAVPRDAGSVWILNPRSIQIGRVRIVPAGDIAPAGAIQLIDASAFGTGLHPTTALCLELLDELLQSEAPSSLLDVGTGSGVLALAALTLGVPQAVGIDVDGEAIAVARENARLNQLEERLELIGGGAATISGAWPLVVANIVAGSLIDIAPALVQRISHHGTLVLSGIPASVAPDVEQAYRRLGMHRVRVSARSGWSALVLRASW